MAVLKYLVSAALFGSVVNSQAIYSAYSPPGAVAAQYSPSILSRGTPRLIPVKVRAAANRLIPSFYYPQIPPPPPPPPHSSPPYKQRLTRQIPHSAYSNFPPPPHFHHRHQPSFPGLFQQYRPSMTGYYRPTRQSFFNFPFRNMNYEHHQPLYQAAATSAPATLKRGRILSGTSSYNCDEKQGTSMSITCLRNVYAQNLEAASASSSSQASAASPAPNYPYQYAPYSSPAVSSAYRPSPYQHPQQIQHHQVHQPQPQIAAAQPQISHHPQLRPQPQIHPQQLVQYQPQIQPNFYIQKSPVVVGPASQRPLKLIKVKKARPAHQVQQVPAAAVAPAAVAEAPEEEEYPGDPNPQYNFSFDIKDDELTNYQNRQEERDGQTIKGSYSVVDPDGYVRTVTYTADPKNGFQAKVTREPTDVKIKFPVPTEAPQQIKNGRRVVTYASPQQQYHQPQQQYQTAAYSSPQQVYASASAPVPQATSVVDVGSTPVVQTPSQRFTRNFRRFTTVQTQAAQESQAEASEPKPKIVAVVSRGQSKSSGKTQTVAAEAVEEEEKEE